MKKFLLVIFAFLALPFISMDFPMENTLLFYTDFETDQWSLSGNGANTWEYEEDEGIPRTTDHPSAAISTGRDGTGRAVWLGDYNSDLTRNELAKDDVSRIDEETWISYAFYLTERLPSSRAYAQLRNRVAPDDPVKGTGVAVKNPITLRQHPNIPGRMYWAMLTDPDFAEVVNDDTGGASADSESWPKNHPDGGYGFDVSLNEWHDVVIHWTKLSYDGTGLTQIWFDGELIHNRIGVNNYRYHPVSGEEYSGFLKQTIGVYWAKTNSPQGNIYFDDYTIRRGDEVTYEDVHPTGASPNGTAQSITSVDVYPTTDKMLVGDTRQLYSVATPQTAIDQSGTWSTSNGSVATVSSSGVVTAIGTGTCTITFTATDTTEGTITDTSSIEVEATSTEDAIMILGPRGYYTSTSGDADSWDDTSGFDLHGTEVGNITFTDQATFDSSSYYQLPDSPFLNYLPSTDEFTLIYREGDTAPTTSGYAIAKRGASGEQQWTSPAYNSGNLQDYYLGGASETAASVALNNNRLVIMVAETDAVNLWVDGLQVINNSSAIGTEIYDGPANIGGRTNGSYLMNDGATLDLVATIPKAISTSERQAIESSFIINTSTATQDNSVKPTSASSSPYFYQGNSKRYFKSN